MDKKFITEWLESEQVKRFYIRPYVGYVAYHPNAVNVIYAGTFIDIENDINTPQNVVIDVFNDNRNPVMKLAYEAVQRYEILHGYIITIPEFNLTGTVSLFKQQSPFGSNVLAPMSTAPAEFIFSSGGVHFDNENRFATGIIFVPSARNINIFVDGNPTHSAIDFFFTGGYNEASYFTNGETFTFYATGDVNFTFSLDNTLEISLVTLSIS